MFQFYRKPIYVISCLCIPFITLLSPSWLTIRGISPAWSVLWLLPWALEDGPFSGLITGFYLGMMQDAINTGGPSQIPALMILGFLWGRLGREEIKIDKIFHLGLLSFFGSLFLGCTLWLQFILIGNNLEIFWFNTWALYMLFSQSMITGLIAPILCSWLLIIWGGRKYL